MTENQLSNKKRDLLIALSRQMNGAVAHSIRTKQTKELLTYGVSLPTIKDIVAPERGNSPLAELMYNSNVRELKLGAVYVMNGRDFTAQSVEEWADGFKTLEIATNSATMLLWHSPLAVQFVPQWIDSEDRLRRAAAAITIASLARNAAADEPFFLDMVNKLSPSVGTVQLIRALAEVGKLGGRLKEAVAAKIATLPDDISSEVEWQIE